MSHPERPPCWPEGEPCPNTCARALYSRVVDNHHALHGSWSGWRFAGRDLVAPDGQRINPERLRGLLMRDAAELRLAGFRSRREAEANKRRHGGDNLVTVHVVQLDQYRPGGLAAG